MQGSVKTDGAEPTAPELAAMNPSPDLTRLTKALLASVTVSSLVAVPLAPPGLAQTAPPAPGATTAPNTGTAVPPQVPSPTGTAPTTAPAGNSSAASTGATGTSPSKAAQAPPTLEEQAAAEWLKWRLWVVVLGILLGSATLIYLGVLWFRPLLLLKLPSAGESIPANPENGWLAFLRLLLSPVRALKYRSPVLDAWVNKHWKQAKDHFEAHDTVKDRSIYLPLPVRLETNEVAELT